MLHECRAALRATIRRPLFAAIVVALLALGIGANSAIFSAVDAVLLKPLPYPGADRLVAIYEANVSQHDLTSLVAPVRLEEWNRMNRSLEGLAGSYFENMTDTSGPLPERVAAMRISPRFFSVLGTPAALGRTPAPEEDRLGGPAVVVVGDPGVIVENEGLGVDVGVSAQAGQDEQGDGLRPAGRGHRGSASRTRL